MKPVIKVVDRTFGHMARAFLRNWIVHPVFVMMYKVTIVGGEAALECKETGSIVVPNHTSRFDGPFLISMAWPHARIRPTAWYAEYENPWQKWLMVLFGTIPLGSPKEPPKGWAEKHKYDTAFLWDAERASRTREAKHTMSKVLRADHHLVVFAEGGINKTGTVEIKPTLSGIFDLVKENPRKPVLMVRIDGFNSRRPWLGLRRKRIKITIKKFANVDTDHGVATFNRCLEDNLNHGTPLPTKSAVAA